MFSRIVVAVDGAATSNRALATAAALAKEQAASLHVLHVIDELVIAPMLDVAGKYLDVDAIVEGLRNQGRTILANAQKVASQSVADVHGELIASYGQPVAPVILRYAKRIRADLIVLGTHGRRGIKRIVMGSDAEGVLREATVPVLLVRSPERSRARRSRLPAAESKRRNVAAQSTAMPGL